MCVCWSSLGVQSQAGWQMKGGANMIPGQPYRACAAATPSSYAQIRGSNAVLTSTTLRPGEHGFLIQSREAVAILK